MRKAFVPEGKTVNAEGVMDLLLKHIQRIHPSVFCPRDFFLLHNNVPAYKAASVCQFLTPKNVTTIYHPYTLQIYLRQTIFCSPSWKWSEKDSTLWHFVDVAEIQEVVTDELKKAQKEEFLAAFQKLYDSVV